MPRGEVGPSGEAARARMTVLREWVDDFQRVHLHRFPAAGTVRGRPAPPPFPDCWEDHPELVRRLALAKMRADQLALGATDDGYRPEDWDWYLDECLLPLIRYLGQVCRTGHVDMSPRPPPPNVPINPPTLPGRPVPRPRAGPAIATGWRDYVPSPQVQAEAREAEGEGL